MAAIKIGAKF